MFNLKTESVISLSRALILHPHPVGFPSWAVRFVAILGLSRVSRVCSKMNLKDGVSAVAWTRLMEAHSVERDKRVMEAYKLRQVGVVLVGVGTDFLHRIDSFVVASPV